MEKQVSRYNQRIFDRSSGLFDGAGPDISAFLAAVGADISVLLTDDGKVIDVAYRDRAIEAWDLEDWVGRPWRETVTDECHEKVEALIEENARTGTTRRRQVNHPGKGGLPDLPVEYSVVTAPNMPWRLALGEDMRKMSELQQQLVRTQTELESEYRKIREAEGRYRTIFHKTAQAIIVVDGDSHNIIDANLTGANLLKQAVAKLIDKPAIQIFERDCRNALTEALNAARHGGARNNLTVHAASSQQPLLAIIEPYRENGRGNLMMTLVPAEETDQFGTTDLSGSALLDAFPEALVIINRKGKIVTANDQFLELTHVLNRNQVLERNLNNWLGASSVDLQVLLSRLREEGQVRYFSTVLRDELGTDQTVAVSANVLPGKDNQAQAALTITQAPRRDSQFAVPAPGANASSDFAELVGRVPLKDLIREAVDVIEKMCIEAALRQTSNNRASAADMLGLSRQSLYIKLRRYELENFSVTGSDSSRSNRR